MGTPRKRLCVRGLLEKMATDAWFKVAQYLGYETWVFGVLPQLSRCTYRLSNVLATRIKDLTLTNSSNLDNILARCTTLITLTVENCRTGEVTHVRVTSRSVQNVTLRFEDKRIQTLELDIPNAKHLRLFTNHIDIYAQNCAKLQTLFWSIYPYEMKHFDHKSSFINVKWLTSCESLVSLAIGYESIDQHCLDLHVDDWNSLKCLQHLELNSLNIGGFDVFSDLPALRSMHLENVTRYRMLKRHSMRVAFEEDKCTVQIKINL
jgi:hypothetical protein